MKQTNLACSLRIFSEYFKMSYLFELYLYFTKKIEAKEIQMQEFLVFDTSYYSISNTVSSRNGAMGHTVTLSYWGLHSRDGPPDVGRRLPMNSA